MFSITFVKHVRHLHVLMWETSLLFFLLLLLLYYFDLAWYMNILELVAEGSKEGSSFHQELETKTVLKKRISLCTHTTSTHAFLFKLQLGTHELQYKTWCGKKYSTNKLLWLISVTKWNATACVSASQDCQHNYLNNLNYISFHFIKREREVISDTYNSKPQHGDTKSICSRDKWGENKLFCNFSELTLYAC